MNLAPLRDAAPPPIERVRRRASRRRARRRALAVGALVGVALLGVVAARPSTTRDRGVAGAPLVSLEAVADGPRGPRPLADGGAVGPDEQVVFFVRSDRPGWAEVREEGTLVWPASGQSWAVVAGENVPGGGSPVAWRPDRPADALRYEARVCDDPEAARCGVAGLTLRWSR